MSVFIQIGRMGSAVGSNVARRGATAEDMQFMQQEAKDKFAKTFEWLNSFAAGKYRIDLRTGFSLTGTAIDVYVIFDDHRYATMAKMRADGDNSEFLGVFKDIKEIP